LKELDFLLKMNRSAYRLYKISWQCRYYKEMYTGSLRGSMSPAENQCRPPDGRHLAVIR
jgi:hypothetical protein